MRHLEDRLNDSLAVGSGERCPRGDDKNLSSTFHPRGYLPGIVQEEVRMGGIEQRTELRALGEGQLSEKGIPAKPAHTQGRWES